MGLLTEERHLSHKQVLIVEDDRAISDALSKLLVSEGYNVSVAYNGEEGIQILNQSKSSPCLILLDLMMPLKDGFKFREEQLQLADHKTVPVVIMTASENINSKTERLHVQDYIRKPVDISTYLNVVKRYCG